MAASRDTPNDKKGTPATEEEPWMDCLLTRETVVDLTHCLKGNIYQKIAENYGFIDVPQESLQEKTPLEPNTAYKFRIAAVNSLGVGPWSEVSGYRTLGPGNPGPVRDIKINTCAEMCGGRSGSIIVTWEPPLEPNGQVTNYTVFLAVKDPSHPMQFVFERVYIGLATHCIVESYKLEKAFYERSNVKKPCIIFRITAENHTGYGAATQIRWMP